ANSFLTKCRRCAMRSNANSHRARPRKPFSNDGTLMCGADATRSDPYDFRTYGKAMSKESFVLDALNPEPSFAKDVVYSEALAVLDAIATATIPASEIAYYLGWLEAQFPGSNMRDLIYWPDEWFGDASLFRDANGAFKPE